jgi:GPH family glycoside/pentoside/hexuronide:cation symporter
MRRAARPFDPALATDLPPASGVDSSERLPLATFVAYGLPRFAMGFVGVVVALYFVKFGTDVLLIAPATMGAIQALARVWDGVTDPLAGYLSDRTRSRFGRRRSWLYVSAFPMMGAVILMWSPPSELGGLWLVLWVAGGILLYETAQDVFLIPHGALGVELSQSYHERTRVFAWNHLFLALGTLFGLAAFWLIEAGDPRARVKVFALVGGAALAATILFAAWKLPERAEYQGRGASNPWHAFRDVVRNPHARLLLGMYAIETFGAGAIFVLAPYMAQYVYGDASLTTLLAAAYLVPQALLTPVWIALAHRLDKKRLWLASMVVTCCGFMTLTFLPGEMRLPLLGVLFVIGVAAGVGAVCAPAIKADIIDFDEYRTGERKEGAYLAVWNFVRKCSAALTPVLAMGSLQLAGYQPNVEQSELTRWVIRGFFGFFPALCFVAGIAIFLRFRFNQSEHAEIRRELDARRSAPLPSTSDTSSR